MTLEEAQAELTLYENTVCMDKESKLYIYRELRENVKEKRIELVSIRLANMKNNNSSSQWYTKMDKESSINSFFKVVREDRERFTHFKGILKGFGFTLSSASNLEDSNEFFEGAKLQKEAILNKLKEEGDINHPLVEACIRIVQQTDLVNQKEIES